MIVIFVEVMLLYLVLFVFFLFFVFLFFFFFSSRRRHTRFDCDWSSDVCSSDLSATSDQREQAADAPVRDLRSPRTLPEQVGLALVQRQAVKKFGDDEPRPE